MSRLQVYTEAPTGGDRVYLDEIGDVRSLRYTTMFPGGDWSAQWQMRLPGGTDHRALQSGRRVHIPIGARTWQGSMNMPQRGDGVWTVTADGAAQDAKRYVAKAPTTGNALKLDEIIDDAISRGLGWTRPSALPTLTSGTQGSGSQYVSDALDYVTKAKGTYWTLSRDLALTAGPLPTNLAYILYAQDTAGGRALSGYVTDVLVTYIRSSDYSQQTITRSAASRPYGRIEVPLDLTNLGAISTSQAQDHGDNYLARHGSRLRFTGAFTVPAGQLLNPGGTAVDLSTVTAADGLVRITLTDPDTAAGEAALGSVQLMAGQFEYDVDADVAYLTPLDKRQVGLGALFRPAA